jgi:hypothetical protein
VINLIEKAYNPREIIIIWAYLHECRSPPKAGKFQPVCPDRYFLYSWEGPALQRDRVCGGKIMKSPEPTPASRPCDCGALFSATARSSRDVPSRLRLRGVGITVRCLPVTGKETWLTQDSLFSMRSLSRECNRLAGARFEGRRGCKRRLEQTQAEGGVEARPRSAHASHILSKSSILIPSCVRSLSNLP